MFKNMSSHLSEFDKKVPSSAFLIYKREASWLIAAFLLICLLSFLAGFFVGQRKAIRAFVQQTSEGALLEQAQPEIGALDVEAIRDDGVEGPTIKEDLKPVTYYSLISVNDKYGQALNLIDLAHKQGVELRIKKSSRKLKNGKRKVTYQIVTAPYSDKEVLSGDLERLKLVSQFKKISVDIRKTEQEG